MNERELRTKLVMQAGFSLSDIPLIMRFINGDDEALTELEEFREWEHLVFAFRDGAEWRINSVWHDVSEKPENERYILVDKEYRAQAV